MTNGWLAAGISSARRYRAVLTLALVAVSLNALAVLVLGHFLASLLYERAHNNLKTVYMRCHSLPVSRPGSKLTR